MILSYIKNNSFSTKIIFHNKLFFSKQMEIKSILKGKS